MGTYGIILIRQLITLEITSIGEMIPKIILTGLQKDDKAFILS